MTGPSKEGALRPWRDHLPDGSGLTSEGLVSSGTLLRAWSARWQSAPDAPLWREPGRSASRPGGPASGSDGEIPVGRRWWTAGEFDEATRRVAGRLRAAGLAPGDRMVWSTAASVAALVANVGALRAGLVVVPLSTAYSERELAHIVTDVRPAAAVVERAEQAEWVRRASPGAVVTVGPEVDLPEGDVGPLDAARPDDAALILYTSGTTGAPKGAVLRHSHLLAGTESVRVAWRWGPEDRLVHCLPLFHAHGLCVGVYGTLLAGASAVLLPGFDPAGVAAEALEEKASLFFGVPTMYHRLVRSGYASDLRRLRLCVSGSAPLSSDLHAAVSAAISSPVLERYGMTETLMLSSNPYDGDRRAGTVGFPLPGVAIMLGAGDEILVRGRNVFDGYWNRPAADAEAFVPSQDGGSPWFRTADQGRDDDGYLVINGRSKELIISGGFNVYPTEVEDVLATHPRVAEVAVTGTPSDEWGEVVTAWIVADGFPPSVDDLAQFTSATLAPYKRPRLVRIVEDLPRNALGKVMRNQLRQ
ncbi:MAG: AMP-binding protein [Acidimicrobiales bacterium]|nr:AMP-binding protein [Acidimicrobiales bacterium]